MWVKRRFVAHIAKPGDGFWGWLAIRLMIYKNRSMNAWGVTLLDPQPADRVLEIGYGAGVTIKALARRVTSGQVAGIDHAPAMLARASRRNRAAIRAGRVELCTGDAHALPYDDAQFDRVLSIATIYYLADPVAALREAWRVLKPGGRVVVMARQPAALAHNPVFTLGHYRAYTAEDIAALVTQAGFARAWIAPDTPDPTVMGILATKR